MAVSQIVARKRVFAAALESTLGTLESLAAAQGVYMAIEPKIELDTDFAERQGQSSHDPEPGVSAGQWGTCTVGIEVAGDGSGGVPTWGSVLLPACCFVITPATQIYTRKTMAPDTVTTNPRTITVGTFIDGIAKKLQGCMGSVVFNLSVAKIAVANFSFEGPWTAAGQADAAIIGPTYPTATPLTVQSATLTIGGTNVHPTEVVININNTITRLSDPGSESGYRFAVATGDPITGTINPEAMTTTTKARIDAFRAGTESALNIILGSANNQVTINLPKIQYQKPPAEDGDRILRDMLTFQANRSSDAGDDAISITFA